MRTHVLKAWPEPFEALLDGTKTYEIRKDDRGFAVGDWLLLREWDPSGEFLPALDAEDVGINAQPDYTGRERLARITYKTPGGSWGLPPDVCVLAIDALAEPQPHLEIDGGTK